MNRFRMAIVLCMAILGVMAVPALAQAHEWSIENGINKEGKEVPGVKTLTELGLSSETISSSGGPFILVSFIGSTEIEIECATETNTGTILPGGLDTATITFSGCKLKRPSLAACSVPNITATTKTELIEVGGKLYDKFIPASGETFATVKIAGETCSLKGSYPVKGTTAGFDASAGTPAVSHTLVFSSAISTAAGTSLTFGTKSATLSGSSAETLSGANTGKKYSSK